MSKIVNVDPREIMLPKGEAYVRGKVDKNNLVRLAAYLTGKDWPFPPVELRKLPKPVKRGKKEFKLIALDGVHRTLLAQHSLGAVKLAALVNAKAEIGAKHATIPATISEMSDVDAEIEQLHRNLTHGAIVDKKKRDAWVRYLVRVRKVKPVTLAKRLHMTERSIFRMAAGTATKTGPRKKSVRRASSNGSSSNGAPPTWTAEGYFKMLADVARETKNHAADVSAYVKDHKDKLGWLEPMLDTLAGS